jgi:hypothetical protein
VDLRFGSAILKQGRTAIPIESKNVRSADFQIGLWLLSGAVPWQTVQVFHPRASFLNSWFFPQFIQYWVNPVGCLGWAWISTSGFSFVPGSFFGIGFVKRWRYSFENLSLPTVTNRSTKGLSYEPFGCSASAGSRKEHDSVRKMISVARFSLVREAFAQFFVDCS